jgi:hypothetical protein
MDHLMASTEPDAEAPRYRELARQLFAVERRFETLGFLSVAKEVAYVERVLDDLDPDEEAPAPVIAVPTEPEQSAGTPNIGDHPLQGQGPHAEDEALSLAERLKIPTPMGITLLALLLAILGAIVTVQVHNERQRRATMPDPTPTAPVVARPTATPQPTAAPTQVGPPATPTRFELAADEIAKARLALGQGDLDVAISRLHAAARLHFANTDVKETAGDIIDALVARADAAAADARWADADHLLERARELSLRFAFSVAPLDRAARSYASMVRFVKLQPDDTDAMRASVGRRVIVYLEGGRTEEGRIHGVTADQLELDQSTHVGDSRRGGEVYYVEPIPMELITEVRVFED